MIRRPSAENVDGLFVHKTRIHVAAKRTNWRKMVLTTMRGRGMVIPQFKKRQTKFLGKRRKPAEGVKLSGARRTGWGLRMDVALEKPDDGYRRCKAARPLNLSGKRTE